MTCLCLTRNRRQWLPLAIRCFQAQTYQNRELLILADGEDVRDLIPDDPNIWLVHTAGHTDIGTKRNFGCSLADGDVIAHWDDDDYSAPGRLADQLERLRESGKAVFGYHAMRFTDGARWWLFRGKLGKAIGTSLCYRRDWWALHPFPYKNVGEDGDFSNFALAREQLLTTEAGELMYATIHSGNTSPRELEKEVYVEL